MIGTYGTITFEASADKIRTWDQFGRKGKARFAQHDVLDKKPRLQFTGLDLEEIGLSIRLDIALGVNPLAEINSLREMRDNGEEQSLMINGRPLGKFVLEDISEDWSQTDSAGRLLAAEVSLKLKEYV